jgi:hypothetical protein
VLSAHLEGATARVSKGEGGPIRACMVETRGFAALLTVRVTVQSVAASDIAGLLSDQ